MSVDPALCMPLGRKLWARKGNLCLEHVSIPGLSRAEGSSIVICHIMTQTNLSKVLSPSVLGVQDCWWGHLCELRVQYNSGG